MTVMAAVVSAAVTTAMNMLFLVCRFELIINVPLKQKKHTHTN